jgi:chemotaxis response regulator CheB
MYPNNRLIVPKTIVSVKMSANHEAQVQVQVVVVAASAGGAAALSFA